MKPHFNGPSGKKNFKNETRNGRKFKNGTLSGQKISKTRSRADKNVEKWDLKRGVSRQCSKLSSLLHLFYNLTLFNYVLHFDVPILVPAVAI